MARGADLPVSLRVVRGPQPNDVRFYVRPDGPHSTIKQIDLQGRAAIGKPALTLRHLSESVSVRAEGGDDQSMPWQSVEVRPPPRAMSLTARISWPDYLERRPHPIVPGEGEIHVVPGSELSVQGASDRPLAAAQGDVTWHDDDNASDRFGVEVAEDSFEATWTIPPFHYGRCQINLTLRDTSGLTHERTAQWNLVIVDDNPPTIAWDRDDDFPWTTPTSSLAIPVTYNDDFSIARWELLLRTGTDDDLGRVAQRWLDGDAGTMPVHPNARPVSNIFRLDRVEMLFDDPTELATLPTRYWIAMRAIDQLQQQSVTEWRELQVVTPMELLSLLQYQARQVSRTANLITTQLQRESTDRSGVSIAPPEPRRAAWWRTQAGRLTEVTSLRDQLTQLEQQLLRNELSDSELYDEVAIGLGLTSLLEDAIASLRATFLSLESARTPTNRRGSQESEISEQWRTIIDTLTQLGRLWPQQTAANGSGPNDPNDQRAWEALRQQLQDLQQRLAGAGWRAAQPEFAQLARATIDLADETPSAQRAHKASDHDAARRQRAQTLTQAATKMDQIATATQQAIARQLAEQARRLLAAALLRHGQATGRWQRDTTSKLLEIGQMQKILRERTAALTDNSPSAIRAKIIAQQKGLAEWTEQLSQSDVEANEPELPFPQALLELRQELQSGE